MAGSISDTAKLVASLELQDKFSGTAAKFGATLGNLERQTATLGRGVGQFASGIGRLATIGIGGFTAAVGASVKFAADFEASLNTINTIAQVTPGQLTAIGQGIRELARETGTSLDDLTKGYYDLLSAGISVADAQLILRQANLLSVGTLGTTAQAVDVLTTAINAFGLTGSDAARVSEELAVAVERGKVTLDQIAPSYANVAQTAAVAGIETGEIAAAFANLTAQGVDAAEVTTQMNRAILSLIAPSTQLNKLQEELGVNFANIAREQGLVVALEELRKAADAAGIPLLDLLGRQEAFKFAIATTGANLRSYNDDLTAVGNATGTLADQVSARRQGLSFQLDVLRANLKDVGITVGQNLLPALTPMVETITDFINDRKTQAGIRTFARELAEGVQDFIAAAKSGDLQPFIDALKLLGTIAGKAVDVFRSLPPDIQALLVTGAALNRLAGGQLFGGALTIGKGLLEIVFQRGASPANPLWVQSVTGGIGGAPGVGGRVPAAGVGGVITTFLGLASAASLGAVLGTFIGRELIAPVLQPAIDLEQTRFDRLLRTGNVAAQQRALDAINEGIRDIQNLGLAQLAFLPELQLLESQRDILQQSLDNDLRREANAANAFGRLQEGTERTREQDAEQAAAEKLRAIQLAIRQSAEVGRLTETTERGNIRTIQTVQETGNQTDRRLREQYAQMREQYAQDSRILRGVDTVAAKRFDPTVAVSVVSSVSISDVQRRIISQQIAIGRGFQEFE
jgi:TP901 family phage tail tape measure protein